MIIKIYLIWLKLRDALYTFSALLGAHMICSDRFWAGLLGEKGSEPEAVLRPHTRSALCTSLYPFLLPSCGCL